MNSHQQSFEDALQEKIEELVEKSRETMSLAFEVQAQMAEWRVLYSGNTALGASGKSGSGKTAKQVLQEYEQHDVIKLEAPQYEGDDNGWSCKMTVSLNETGETKTFCAESDTKREAMQMCSAQVLKHFHL